LVFIRDKKIKGHSYAYLVRNVWNNRNGKVRQEIVKYLGRSNKVVIEDIPIEYQKDPNIISFIARHSTDVEKMELTMKEELLDLLIRNDMKSLVDTYKRYSQFYGLVKFYERLVAPVMHNVGELWATGKLNVASEHICSNSAHTLVKLINERISMNTKKNRISPKILICTPEGEYHSLGCMIIESYLKSKGYSVSNIAPSVPSDSVIAFASKYEPDLIMISITLADNIGAANKLINKILESKLRVTHILVGGIGIERIKTNNQNKDIKKVRFLKGTKLSGILPSIKEIKVRTKI